MPVFENTMAIGDWQVYRMDAVTKTVAGNVLLDHIAARYPGKIATLGDLRALMEANWDPRMPTRRRQCPA